MNIPSIHETLHYDSTHPCCESPSAADLFPDLLRLDHNTENRGRIASIFFESLGLGIHSRRLTIDESAWCECVKHPNFQACYDLSMARLALQKAMLEH